MTQADRLFALLRRRSMTYMDLILTGISVAPWKRLAEAEHRLLARGEQLIRGVDKCGRRVFRVRKVAR